MTCSASQTREVRHLFRCQAKCRSRCGENDLGAVAGARRVAPPVSQMRARRRTRSLRPAEPGNVSRAARATWRGSWSRPSRHLVDAAHRRVELVAPEHVGFESGRGLEPTVRLNHVEQPEPSPGAVENLITLETRG